MKKANKTETIVIRIAAKEKKEASRRADRRGLSVTQFVLLTVLNSVFDHNGPAFTPDENQEFEVFRSFCRIYSGPSGYRKAGMLLGRLSLFRRNSNRSAMALVVLLKHNDMAGAWACFRDLYPRCAAIVPVKRRAPLLAGLHDAIMPRIARSMRLRRKINKPHWQKNTTRKCKSERTTNASC